MPDKDGDEGKSTKSVVNKKQKQMMGEEGYDIARDMGRVRPSKDKKDATTMPPSKEMEKTRKVNKGPSAFERVKAKYGKSVMKVEELDLTQVAEAFGGYIVEAPTKKPENPSGLDFEGQSDQFIKNERNKKKILRNLERKAEAPEGPKFPRRGRKSLTGNIPKKDRVSSDNKALQDKLDAEAERRVRVGSQQKPQDFSDQPLTDAGAGERKIDTKGLKRDPDTGEVIANPLEPKSKPGETQLKGVQDTDLQKLIKRGRPVGSKDKTKRYVAKNPSKKDEVIAAMTPGQKERNIRRIKKDIDSRNPTIDTEVGKVPYRNRRVPKTRSLVPQYDRTPEIMKPDTDELLKFKDFRKKTKTTTAELDKTKEFKAPPIPKPKVSLEDPTKEKKKETDTQTQASGGGGGGKGPRITTSGGETFSGGDGGTFNSIKKFAKQNPVASLALYDIGKGVLGKIMKAKQAVPGVRGGTVGRRSARGGGGL